MNKTDVLVIGAGVVGLAIARELAMSGRDVVVVESLEHYGSGTSARNSGVIHAGIYYPQGSKKAMWCVRGRHLLYEFMQTHHVTHRRLGKLIVARQSEADLVHKLYETGRSNGVDDLALLTRQEVRALEPEIDCDLAIHSPSTGIVDAHELMQALLADAESHGALLAVQSRFNSAEYIGGVWVSQVLHENIGSNVLINAAGLDAIPVARAIAGLSPQTIPPMHFAKGNYARLNVRNPFSRLVYPVPVPGGLGTHLTIDLGGQAQFGPDVQWLDAPGEASIRAGLISTLNYRVDESRLSRFEADIRNWWPGLPSGALSPAYAGIRPKIVGPNAPAADFMVHGPAQHGVPGLVNLFGIESPGLTSCLAIAQEVKTMV